MNSNDDTNDPLNPSNLAPSNRILGPDDKPLKHVPSPEIRSEMARDAIKMVPVLQKYMLKKQQTIAEEAHAKLELLTRALMYKYEREVREAINAPTCFKMTAEVWDDIAKRLRTDILAATASAGREELHIMLSTVLLGLFMEELQSVY